MHHSPIPVLVVLILFIGLPWLVLHYVTKWKTAPKLTGEDERLLDELHALARRCDERLGTVERIIAAENPGWCALASDTLERAAPEINDMEERLRRIK